MADSGKIIMWGAIGIGAWYLYENWATLFGAPVAASAPAANAGSAGSGAASGASASGSPVSSGSPAGNGAASSAVSPSFWASLFNLLNLRVATAQPGDSAVTLSGGVLNANPDVFNYYLGQLFPSPPSTVKYTGSAGWPPDVNQVFPGVDRTQPMSITTYWNGVSGYLAKNTVESGVSGLGRLLGLGCASRYGRAYATPGNPANGGYYIQ